MNTYRVQCPQHPDPRKDQEGSVAAQVAAWKKRVNARLLSDGEILTFEGADPEGLQVMREAYLEAVLRTTKDKNP